jgi:hypothetical protein
LWICLAIFARYHWRHGCTEGFGSGCQDRGFGTITPAIGSEYAGDPQRTEPVEIRIRPGSAKGYENRRKVGFDGKTASGGGAEGEEAAVCAAVNINTASQEEL